MEAYTGFAYVYDEYMDNIPYDEWEYYLYELLKENNIGTDSTIADLGCGTGTVTRMLDKEGYDILGIDLSEDMLSIASEKTYESGQQIIYSCQDMREFELPYEAYLYLTLKLYIFLRIYCQTTHMQRTEKILHLYGITIMMMKVLIMNMSLRCL